MPGDTHAPNVVPTDNLVQQAQGERLAVVETKLGSHEQLLHDIKDHLHELVDRIDKFKLYGLASVVIIFMGTKNGSTVVSALGGLFK